MYSHCLFKGFHIVHDMNTNAMYIYRIHVICTRKSRIIYINPLKPSRTLTQEKPHTFVQSLESFSYCT